MPRSTKSATLTQSAAPAAKTISKSEAIRQAIAAGFSEPKEALPWIREQYGITMSPQHFSTVKTRFNKPRGGSASDVITDLETIRPVVARHGVENVKRMLELCK